MDDDARAALVRMGSIAQSLVALVVLLWGFTALVCLAALGWALIGDPATRVPLLVLLWPLGLLWFAALTGATAAAGAGLREVTRAAAMLGLGPGGLRAPT
jgi:hypothetical protein